MLLHQNGGEQVWKDNEETSDGGCYMRGSNRIFDFWLQRVGHQQMTPHILSYSSLLNPVRPILVMRPLHTCSPSYPLKLRQENCFGVQGQTGQYRKTLSRGEQKGQNESHCVRLNLSFLESHSSGPWENQKRAVLGVGKRMAACEFLQYLLTWDRNFVSLLPFCSHTAQ